MIRYVLSVIAMLAFGVLNLVLAPVLPLFAKVRNGWSLNHSVMRPEPRLPNWLSWFDCEDNSLWGDCGWQTEHCPYFKSYFGMVRWLWRNPAAGFCWKVLSFPIDLAETFTLLHSGNGLDVDKGQGKYGWYFIKSSSGAFSLRWCKKIGKKVLSFEAGWLLDVYLKDASAKLTHPKATFQFQPQIKTAKV